MKHGVPLDALLDDAPAGFLSFSDDGTIQAVNGTLLTMLNLTRADVVDARVETLLTVGSRIFYQTHFFPMLRLHGRAEEIFLLLRSKDNGEIAALVNAVRRERHGSWITDCVIMQVRERQKFEDALLRAKQQADDARRSAELQRAAVETANAQLERQALELELTQRQSEELSEELSAQTEELSVQAEELGRINDELMLRSEELEQQRVVAEEANRAKSTFLASMSHELRTPLNAIGGYVQLLDMGIHGAVTDAQRDALAKIARSQRHLLRLINEVLNFARVEAGRVEYSIHAVPILDVIEGVRPMIEPQLAARRLLYEVDIPRSEMACVDLEKMEQVLLNLLSNAIKFTPPDGRITVSTEPGDGADRPVRLLIRDTGIGIPADRLSQVFDPFVQVDTGHTRNAQGTGLGLAISRDLVRGMGGDLTAESTLGAGSTFILTLPRAESAR
jgi:signal transduction histidine kinase